jgi:hypothetical protein
VIDTEVEVEMEVEMKIGRTSLCIAWICWKMEKAWDTASIFSLDMMI